MKLRVLFDSKGHAAKVAILENTCGRVLIEPTIIWAIKTWRLAPPPGFKGGYVDVPIVYQLPSSRPLSNQ